MGVYSRTVEQAIQCDRLSQEGHLHGAERHRDQRGRVCSDMGTSIVGRIMLWSYSYCNRKSIVLYSGAKRKHSPLPPTRALLRSAVGTFPLKGGR